MIDKYYKSLDIVDGQVQLVTIENREKRTSQTLRHILERRIISPNTNHKTLKKRLCVNIPIGWYAASSYRKNGILFQTDQKPDYSCPFDIMKLTKNPEDTSSTNGSEFIPGHKEFLFYFPDEMIEAFPNACKAEQALNKFRKKQGHKETKGTPYNEAGFYKAIPVEALALFGPDVKDIAKEFGIDHHGDVSEMSRALLYSDQYRSDAKE